MVCTVTVIQHHELFPCLRSNLKFLEYDSLYWHSEVHSNAKSTLLLVIQGADRVVCGKYDEYCTLYVQPAQHELSLKLRYCTIRRVIACSTQTSQLPTVPQ